jgi:cystathionine beta-lyase/cystathionine gamma-synthase
MFDVVLPRFNVSTTYIDGTKIENWKQATRANTTLYYLESPNSWTFALQDIKAVASLAKPKDIITAIDNSYCTPLQQNVIAMGVDLAIQTATKYIGGHSDTLGGVLSGSRIMIKRIFDSEYLNIGSGIQPFNAWLLIRGLRTLPIRLNRINGSTAQLIDFLKQHPKIESIIFPFDPSFPQYELAKQQMKSAGGLVTFIIKAKTREKIVEFCESLKHFMMAVSWGGHESLILPQCASIKSSDFDSNKAEHRSIRMYVGLEEPSYLVSDLEQALSKIC